MDNLFKTEDPGRCLGIRLRLGLPVLTVFKDVMRKKWEGGWAELFLAEIEKVMVGHCSLAKSLANLFSLATLAVEVIAEEAGLVLAEFEVIGRPLLASKNELQSRLLLKTQFC
ncbi:hypothetical protein PPACK8108_LOCUS1963 [Phakopsora pachyrhizi]|uniref:Uncharacterized protein n=1 Tax=Phakopsora pachyrhizi TaxID=170000 RepID=A0AAV0AHZ2_PHAPC|nr:hypothetical protein PPACK8108_LOCUS1963 [Phakopsora pachyrhizi]